MWTALRCGSQPRTPVPVGCRSPSFARQTRAQWTRRLSRFATFPRTSTAVRRRSSWPRWHVAPGTAGYSLSFTPASKPDTPGTWKRLGSRSAGTGVALTSCSTRSPSDMAPLRSTDRLRPLKRLAIVTGFLGKLAGTERYTVTVACALAGAGIAVDVYVAEPPRDLTWIDILRSRDVSVHLPAAEARADQAWRLLDHRIAAGAVDLVLVNPW